MRALALALLVAAPALAQSTAESEPLVAEPDIATVDPMLVGTWTLDDVDNAGTLDEMGADIEGMVCTFGSDGSADVAMTIVQDLDTIVRQRTFGYETTDGRIVSDEDDQPMAYRFLEDGRLEIRHPLGLTIHLSRAGE